jgi:L-threonylcarbamoyladenylate synthase
VDIVLDSGASELGQSSTVVDLTGQKPRILRKGALPVEDIVKVVGEVEEV